MKKRRTCLEFANLIGIRCRSSACLSSSDKLSDQATHDLSPAVCRALGVACILEMLIPNIAQAQGADSAGCDIDCDETSVTLGVGGGYAPEFEGGDEYEIGIVPLISVENFYGFNATFGQLSYNLIKAGGESQGWFLMGGPAIGLSEDRDEDDSDDLDGLGDVDGGVDVGGFANLAYGPVLFDLTITQEVADGHEGMLVSFGVGTQVPITERFGIGPSISTTWADDNYMDSFFGVDAGQAADSGLDEFDADAGFKNISLELGAFYEVTDQIGLQAAVGYSRLLGDAADSPIVSGSNGSPNQFQMFLGAAYQFSF